MIAATRLPLPTLISCLEDRASALRQAGGEVIPLGGLAELLEQAIDQLRTAEARSVRAVVETRRDYGGQ